MPETSHSDPLIAKWIATLNPTIHEEHLLFSPHVAYQNDGFESHYFDDLYELEGNHFWFKARNQLIVSLLKKYHPDFNNYLEIGCGTGFVTTAIAANFPAASLYASEIFLNGLKYAKQRLPEVQCLQIDITDVALDDSFDTIGSFDVLEHIENDIAAIQNIHRSLKKNGVVILTVPQHPWLWSQSDNYACHKRRYAVNELDEKLIANGFDILYSSGFITLLLPLMMLSRQLQKNSKKTYDPTAELKQSKIVNSICYQILKLENYFLTLGLKLKLGGSRIVVAKKR